jgi:hypothetical protein
MMGQILRVVEMATPTDTCVSSRREWFAGVLGLTGMTALARGQPSSSQSSGAADEAGILKRVQDKAAKSGLGPIVHSRREHFIGLGDAPVEFLNKALDLCEDLSKAFLSYFQERGFQVSLPGQRLTVIVLKDAGSYRAYLEEEPPPSAAGHYEVVTNELVVFDNRSRQEELAAKAGWVNLFTLAHEAGHLLTFNTGLLSRQADVPVCISEGLATYVELWQPRARSPFGATNRLRLQPLRALGRSGSEGWISMADLLADDDLFDKPATTDLALGEGWLLVHTLMKTTPAWLSRFQAYLVEMPKERGAKARLAHAEARLGSLSVLDRDVRRHMARELER